MYKYHGNSIGSGHTVGNFLCKPERMIFAFWRRILTSVGLAVLLAMLFGIPIAAETPTGYQEYYILGNEELTWRAFRAIYKGPTASMPPSMCSTINLVATVDQQMIYYDHWEDGYEGNLLNPIQSTTEVHLLTRGQTLSLTSMGSTSAPPLNQYVPGSPTRNVNDLRYDGGDRIIASGGPVALSHALWPYNSSWAGGAWEIYSYEARADTYAYHIPIGEDLYTQGGGDEGLYGDFRYVYLHVSPYEDNTTLLIDNGAGQSVNVTLHRGQTYSSQGYVNSTGAPTITIRAGSTVLTNKPVQVGLVTGSDSPSYGFQGRFLVILPSDQWGADYVIPVPRGYSDAASRDVPAELYIANPNDYPITVQAYDSEGAHTFVLSETRTPSATLPYSLVRGEYAPADSAVRFNSNEGNFNVVLAADTSQTNFDWGFSAIPNKYLNRDYHIPWAPGSADLSVNGSPVWVTPVADDTVFYVDYSPVDGIVDTTFTLDVLAQRRLFDPDHDNTGTHIWATGKFACVWGEDPATAGVTYPYMDLGMSILPVEQTWLDPVMALDLTAWPTIVPPTGASVTFTLAVQAHRDAIGALSITHTLPLQWRYLTGTASVTDPAGNVTPMEPQGLPQNLIWTPTFTLQTAERLTITFQAEITDTTGISVSTHHATAVGRHLPSGVRFSPDDNVTLYINPLNVVHEVSHSQAQVGQSLVYTLTYSNRSAAPTATHTTLYTVIPLQYVAFIGASTGGTYQADSSALTWDVGNLPPGAGGSVTFTVHIHDFIEDGVVIESLGQIASDQTATARSNVVRTTVQAARLTLMADGPAIAYPGDLLTYTVTYTNQGNGNASGVVISNVIPISTTYLPGSLALRTGADWMPLTDAADGDAGDFTDLVLTVRPEEVPGSAAGQIRYNVRVATTGVVGRSILNVAAFDSQQDIPRNSNLVVTYIAALRLWQQATQDVALPGSVISYTLQYQNLSTSYSQTNISVLEPIPAHTRLISGSVSSADQIAYSWDGIHWSLFVPLTPTTHVRWRDITLGANATVTLNLAVRVNDTLPANTFIQNQAYISSTQHYQAMRDWLTSNPLNIPIFDVQLEKHASVATLYAGESLTYTIQVRNNGSLNAPDLHITDTLPPGATYRPDSIFGPGGDDTLAPQLQWGPITLLTDTIITLGYAAQTESSLAPGTILTNTALLESPYPLYLSAPVTVLVNTGADLSLTQTATPDPVQSGATLTYTLHYTNPGPSDAQNVVLTDGLPPNVTFGSLVAMTPPLQGPTQFERRVEWYTPTLPAHTGGVVTFTVQLNTEPATSLTNIAAITSTTTELVAGNDIVTATTPIIQFIDLALTQDDVPADVAPGERLTYTLRFANLGLVNTYNITLGNALPENFALTAIVSAGVTPILIASGPDYVWELPSLAVDEWGIITLTGSITPGLTGGAWLTNTACITPSVADDNPGNNCAAVTTIMRNVPPTPRSDHILAPEGASVSVLSDGGTSLLDNDTDPNLDPLTVVITPVVNVAHGVLTLRADGAFTYTHDGSETTADEFVYQVCDAGEWPLCAAAAVSITVIPVNNPPVAVSDRLTVAEGSAIHLAAPGVLGNDCDPDLPDEVLTAALVTTPTFGTVILTPAGAITYTHAGGEEPYDNFYYQVCDDGLPQLCDITVVSITILPVADPPVAVDDALTVVEGGCVTTTATGAASVLANDYDPDRPPAPLTATLVSDVAHGILTLAANGAFTYTHDDSENHSDSFSYQACKTTAPQLCATATASITVTPSNDPPTISPLPDLQLYVNARSSPQSFTVGDVDTPLTALTLAAVSSDAALAPPAQMAFAGADLTRTLTLTPGAGLTGTTLITVSVSDGSADASATFTLTVIERPPICLPLIIRHSPIIAPDLVVEVITVTTNNIELAIANHGLTPVTGPFWVDVYVRPITPPTHVNQTWNSVGQEGLVWGGFWNDLPLEPGESLQLSYNGPYYNAGESHVNWPIRVGDWIYAQVDSANSNTTYGAILEVDEIGAGPYNNILGVQFLGVANAAAALPPPSLPPALPPPQWADLPRRE